MYSKYKLLFYAIENFKKKINPYQSRLFPREKPPGIYTKLCLATQHRYFSWNHPTPISGVLTFCDNLCFETSKSNIYFGFICQVNINKSKQYSKYISYYVYHL